MPKIIINVPKGARGITTSVDGAKGAVCRNLTKAFEDALGSVVSSKDTHEALEEPVDQRQLEDQ